MLAVPYLFSANDRSEVHTMPDQRSLATPISIAIAVLCAAWAIYATQHKPAAGAGPGAGRAPGGRENAPAIVTLAPVRAERISQKLEALGNARANESVDISTKTSNIVTAVRFRDGERVKRGQVLVQLDDAQARADVAEAQAALSESESQYNRSRELLNTQALSKSSFDQLEGTLKANRARLGAAQARLEDTVIRAPFSGRVGLRRVSVGTLISPGDVITTLDDTSVIKLDFSVPENFLATLREGLSIRATAPAYPGRSFTGSVSSIDSRVDMNTRSVTVRALLANEDGALKPGMFLNVMLANDERAALVIPEEALTPEAERQYVFVVADGKASRREVRIGGRRPGSVEILAGLNAGERVIVEGTQKVRDGAVVRAIERAAEASPTEGGAAIESHEASATAASPARIAQ
jgi:membrane fusion protein, multidrug efflux system